MRIGGREAVSILAVVTMATAGCSSAQHAAVVVRSADSVATSSPATLTTQEPETTVESVAEPTIPDESIAVTSEAEASIATVPASTAAHETGVAYSGRLTFAWPVDCAVTVTETLEDADRNLTLGYTVDIATAPNDRIRISQRDFEITDFRSGGKPIPSSRWPELAPAYQKLPFFVDEEGRFVDVEFEPAPNSTAAPGSVDSDLQELKKEAALRGWYLPVIGTWASRGSVRAGVSPIEVPDTSSRTTVEIESLPTPAGSARLRLTGVTPVDLRQSSIDELRIAYEAVLDPLTLRPTTVATSTTAMKDGVDVPMSEFPTGGRTTWAFDWGRSSCSQ